MFPCDFKKPVFFKTVPGLQITPLFVVIKPLPYIYSPNSSFSPLSPFVSYPVIHNCLPLHLTPVPVYPTQFLYPIVPFNTPLFSSPVHYNSSLLKPQIISGSESLVKNPPQISTYSKKLNFDIEKKDDETANVFKIHSKSSRKISFSEQQLFDAVCSTFSVSMDKIKIPRGKSQLLEKICKQLNLQYNEANRNRICKSWNKLKNSN